MNMETSVPRIIKISP